MTPSNQWKRHSSLARHQELQLSSIKLQSQQLICSRSVLEGACSESLRLMASYDEIASCLVCSVASSSPSKGAGLLCKNFSHACGWLKDRSTAQLQRHNMPMFTLTLVQISCMQPWQPSQQLCSTRMVWLTLSPTLCPASVVSLCDKALPSLDPCTFCYR